MFNQTANATRILCCVILMGILLHLPLHEVYAQSVGSLSDIERVTSMAWNSDGSTLAISGFLDNEPGIWFYDANSGGIGSGITSNPLQFYLVWSPDSTMIVGVSINDIGLTYTVFSVSDGGIVSQFEIETRLMPIHWSSDSTLLMVGMSRGITIYNALDGSVDRELFIPIDFPRGGEVFTTAWDTHDARAYGVYGIRDVLVWDFATTEIINTIEFPSTITFPIALNTAGDTFAVEGPSGKVLLVDSSTLSITSTLQVPSTETIRDIVWHEDNIHLATFSFDRTIRVWNTQTGALVETIIVGEMIDAMPIWRPGTDELTYSPVSGSPVIAVIEAISIATPTPTLTITPSLTVTLTPSRTPTATRRK